MRPRAAPRRTCAPCNENSGNSPGPKLRRTESSVKTPSFFIALACVLACTTGAAQDAVAAPAKAKPAAARNSSKQGPAYATREEAMRFADDLAERRGLDREWVRKAIGEARNMPVVSRLMQPAPTGTPKNWRVYRSRFIDNTRINAGVRFWQDNRAALERAEQAYGVPPEIIVGIIGVETIYGQQMGTFRVIDALTTLAFDFPASHPRAAARTEFFQGELEQFLSLQSRTGGDPMQPVGSYAGAMGMPQFMPSSWVKYAVDFDGDGKIDLTNSATDVIGSVASYFKAFDWKPGMPTHYAVSLDGTPADKEALLVPDILPTFSAASFAARGAVLGADAQAHKGPLALVELQNGAADAQYVAGTENFYAITRYNWSSYYAMAVIELGREIKAALPPR
ncbi:MAG: lytic murein transglycosylase B [Comamonadaceae bacterium]|nr:MAG: lytic murein transglycosylase B [Comamonadaceae bacterium]